METSFVQIGYIAFQPAQIKTIYFDTTGDVWIAFDRSEDADPLHLQGLSALAFKNWWDTQVGTYRLEPEWFEEEYEEKYGEKYGSPVSSPKA